MGSEIIICGRRFDVGHPVVTFEEEGGFSAYVPHRTDDPSKVHAFDPAKGLEGRTLRYRYRRTMGRERQSIERLRRVVRQVVVHLDGCRDAKMCFSVLHNQRGLSVHFLVDNDGTIYQCLDLADCAFHAGGVNEISVGLELQNRGDAARSPNYYEKRGLPPRQAVTCRVHGAQFLAYDYTDAQYQAMIKLSRVLSRVLQVPLTSPRDERGALVWTTIDEPRRFEGFIGHFHLSDKKWDPGPFDFRRMLRGVGSQLTFPLTARPGKDRAAEAGDPQPEGFEQQARRYYDLSEQEAPASFPVGPLGRSRLWHGGLHLPASEGKPVYAPIAGRVVAGRMAAPCSIGDCNFVLLRHALEGRRRTFTFFSLYYHLQREGDQWGSKPAAWLAQRRGLATRLDRGDVVLLDHGVEAGEPIGHVGLAGPQDERRGQIHFAIFSAEEISQSVDPGGWEVIEGSRSSRICRARSIIERIDRPEGGKPRDGMLSRIELRRFFARNPRREEFRNTVVRHRSEWTPGDWQRQLSRVPDFAALSADVRRRLIARQIKPTLWWTSRVARHAKLPEDGYIYSYHPIGFLVWYKRLLARQANARAAGIEGADRWEGKAAPKHLTVDAESGEAMADAEDFLSGDQGRKLTLEDLVDGYPEEE